MTMRLGATLLCCLLAHPALGQVCGQRTSTPEIPQPEIALTFFLVGDAGLQRHDCRSRPLCNDTVLRELEADVTARAAAIGREKVVVVFLGDNIYPEGLDSTDARTGARLDAQVDVVRRSGVRAFFVPGNHDWKLNDFGGQARIREEAARLAAAAAVPNGPRVEMRPRNACPGPEVETFGTTATLVFMDTAWFLQPMEDRPACGGETAVLAQLRTTLAGLTTPVVVVSHHAFEKSAGKHGTSGFDKQDFGGTENKRMRTALQTAVRASGKTPMLWAAGHDHSLQLLTGGAARFHLVSGTGFVRSPTRVRCGGADLAFGAEANGWAVLDFPADGSAPRLAIREVPRATPEFARTLQ